MDISLSLRKLRRTIAGLSLLAVLVTMSFAGVAKAQTFSDVDSDSWYYEYVETLVEQGAVTGYDNETFGPANYLTRAEAAKIMVLAYVGEDELDNDYDAGFSDVDENAWYAVYVNTAAKLGIVAGYTNEDGDATGEFGPGDYINRAAFAKMVVGAAGLETDTTDAPHFSDVDDGAWYYDYVETAYNNTVIDGYSNGTFGPGNNVNRAEACKMVVLGETPVLRYTEAEECDEGYEWDGTACVEVVAAEECDAGYEWDTTTEACVVEDTTVSDGTLTVAMGDVISGVSLPKGATSVEMLNVEFTAVGGDVELDGFILHRMGVGASTDFAYLYIYEGDTRLTSGKTIASDTNSATFGSLNKTIEDGETVTLTIVADLTTTATTGDESAFEILSADVVDSNATEVSGTFAITSGTFTVAGSSAGTVTIAKIGSIPNPTIGDIEAEVAEFQLTAASEDMALTRLSLIVKGTVDATALSNFKLWQGSTVVGTVDEVNSDELVVFAVDGNYNCSSTSYTDAGYCITKGNSKTFNVTADLGSTADPAETIKIYLEESTDLRAVGLVYGYGAQVTYTSYDGGTGTTPATWTDSSGSTVQGGQFTVSHHGPASTDVAINAKDVILTKMTFTSGRNIEIKHLTAELTASVGSGLILDDVTDVANFTDIKLVELDDEGAIVETLMGPGDLSITGLDTTQTVAWTDTWTMDAGESVDVAITCDIANYASLAGTTIQADLDLISVTEGLLDVDTNEYITDIVPSADPTISANPMTVRAATLAVSLASTPTSDTFVKGTSDVNFATFTLSAGAAMDVDISQIVVAGYIDDNNSGTDFTQGTDNLIDIKNVITSVWLEDDEGNQIGLSKTFSSGDATFSSLDLTILAGVTETLKVYGNISSSAPFGGNSDYVYVDIDTVGTDITAQDEEGNTVTPTGATTGPNGTEDAPSVYMTVASAGTLAIAEDTADQLEDQVVAQGEEDLLIGRFKVTAGDEDWKITKLTFTATGTVAGADQLAGVAPGVLSDDIKSLTIKYPNDLVNKTDLDGVATGSMAGTNVTFSGLTLMAPKDSMVYFEVYADLTDHALDGGGLDSDDGIRAMLNTGDKEASTYGDLEAVGQGSSTTKTEANYTDITCTNVTYVYRTVPTVANVSSINSSLITGSDQEIYRFSVLADGNNELVFKYLTLDLNPTGLVTGNVANSLTNNPDSIDNVGQYVGSGMCAGNASYVSAPLFIKEYGKSTVVGTGCYDAGNKLAKFDLGSSLQTITAASALGVEQTSGITIGAGATKTFSVFADVYEDSDTSTSASLSTRIHQDTTHIGTKTLAQLKGSNNTNLSSATGMIWSDEGHATTGEHGSVISEWYVGFKVHGMPVSYMTLS